MNTGLRKAPLNQVGAGLFVVLIKILPLLSLSMTEFFNNLTPTPFGSKNHHPKINGWFLGKLR